MVHQQINLKSSSQLIFIILKRHIKVTLMTESASQIFFLQFGSSYFVKSQNSIISQTPIQQTLKGNRNWFNIAGVRNMQTFFKANQIKRNEKPFDMAGVR